MGGCAHPPLRGYDGDPATGGHTGPPLQTLSCRGRRPRRPASTAQAAPAEREPKGIRDLPGGFLRTPTRGQGVFRLPKVRRVPVGDCPGFDSTHSGQPPYLSQLARRRKFGAWRSFLLDRPRPIVFSARSKRKRGVVCQAINMAYAPVPSDAPPPRFRQTSSSSVKS